MLRAKINGKVRNVSPSLARRLRAKGIAVEGAGPAPVKPPPPPQVKKLEDVLPTIGTVPLTVKLSDRKDAPGATVEVRDEKAPTLPAAPWPTQPQTIEPVIKVQTPADRRAIVDDSRDGLRKLVKTERAPIPPRLTTLRGETVNVLPDDVRDLTDEELERLTAPDSQSGGEG